MKDYTKNISSSQIIILGFAAIILIGSLLLMLPFASKGAGGTSFSDALFTAISAVCVTGLAVQDTATYWSSFGQAVILLLIQIGGMGVMTIAVSAVIISGKKIGLKQRSTMQEAISAPRVAGIIKLTGFIFTMTFVFEFLGAFALSFAFCKEFGLGKGIWYSIFHSISAFCNAGFDLMGVKEPFSSLTYFSGNVLVNIVIMFLIVIGGIGFMTWADIRTNKFHFRKYQMQSKAVLLAALLLILVPALFFFFLEFSDMGLKERLLCSFFQSVTPRTAGFNTVDFNQMSDVGIAIMTILMLIGGSPGSTAGGMKTTTVVVLVCTAVCVFQQKTSAHCFKRRIPEDTIRNAATIMTMYVILFLFGSFTISEIEGLPLMDCMFETASAIGTTGLTLGITTKLGLVSRIILMALMYLGRVGGLTLIFATVTSQKTNVAMFPQEKMTVG